MPYQSRRLPSALLGWENAAKDEQFSQLDAVARINVEDIDGRTPAGGKSDKLRPLPRKVTVPALPAGIEQFDDATCDKVAAAQIAGFGCIAFEA